MAGVSCYFPGGDARGNYLAAGTDGVVEVPFARWDLDEYWDPNPDAVGKMYPVHGGFVEGAELFASAFFGISLPEARGMDPQQRLILEVSYNALGDAAFTKKELLHSDTAVLVGQSNNDWIQVQDDIRALNPYTATGTSASISAARVAYCLGLVHVPREPTVRQCLVWSIAFALAFSFCSLLRSASARVSLMFVGSAKEFDVELLLATLWP